MNIVSVISGVAPYAVAGLIGMLPRQTVAAKWGQNKKDGWGNAG